MPEEFVKVARAGELPGGEKMLVELEDERILLVNIGGKYYAVGEECPHALAMLSMGQLYGEEIVCPVHGSGFNVKSGEVLSPPAREDLACYPVRVEGDDILIGPAN